MVEAGDAPLLCPDLGEAEMVLEASTNHCYVLWPYRLIDMHQIQVYMFFQYLTVLIKIFVNYRIS